MAAKAEHAAHRVLGTEPGIGDAASFRSVLDAHNSVITSRLDAFTEGLRSRSVSQSNSLSTLLHIAWDSSSGADGEPLAVVAGLLMSHFAMCDINRWGEERSRGVIPLIVDVMLLMVLSADDSPDLTASRRKEL